METDEIVLAHTRNDISFEFTALHFGRPLKNPVGEQFDYLRVQEIFRDIADQPPQAIIDRMVDAGKCGVKTSNRMMISP